jgi:hypothetical protein
MSVTFNDGWAEAAAKRRRSIEANWREYMTCDEADLEEALRKDIRCGNEPELARQQLSELRDRVIRRLLY